MDIKRISRVIASMGAVTMLVGSGCQGSEGSDVVIDETPGAYSQLPGPQQVGELVQESISSPAVTTQSEALVWSQELHYAGATYIAPHFASFDLPEGAYLVVRDAHGVRSRTYRGVGKEVPGEQGFWGTHMPGERAILELYSRVPVAEGAVVIDHFARGTDAFTEFAPESIEKAICGSDDSQWAKCLQTSEPTVYDRSRAVARLMIGGTSACTGWLVGSEGHLMTNNHCISTASEASNTDYEFMAEGACNDSCTTWGGCPGVVEASSGTLIQTDSALDYSLILLPNNISGTYGYLQMRSSGASVGERIYIPQHPQAWGKRIATKDGNSDAVVTSVSEPGCTGGKVQDVGYFADTQGGSSGSPVLGYADHAVVALHHCANCPNRGVPVQGIINDLSASGNLPADSTTGTAPPPPECLPAGSACTADSECCSASCKGRPGGQTCK